MGFQTKVSKAPAKGVAGDKASLNPAVYTDRNYVAGDANISVGGFVFEDSNNESPEEGSGVFTALSSGETVLGFVERNLSYMNYSLTTEGTLLVPAGSPLNVAIKGDYYIVADADCTAGGTVYAGENGVASVSSGVETSWIVKEGGASGDVVCISNWGV